MKRAFIYAAEIRSKPTSHSEAIKSPNVQKWKKAKKEELKALSLARTWIEVDRLKDRSVISYKWVYKNKQNSEGKIERHKTRLMVKDFS